MQLFPDEENQFCHGSFIYAAGHCIFESHKVDPLLLSIFQVKDALMVKRKYSSRHSYVFSPEWEELTGGNIIEDAIIFQNTAKNIKDRLNIMNITMKTVESEFNDHLAILIKKKKEEQLLIDEEPDFEDNGLYNCDTIAIGVLEKLSFINFIEAIRVIINNKYYYTRDNTLMENENYQLINYLLEDINKSSYLTSRWGFGMNSRNLLRIVVEVINPEDILEYDVTDEKIKCNERSIQEFHYNIIYSPRYNDKLNNRFIILAEGSTDIKILKASLEILYPHLVEYYSFMDFHTSNQSGGASSLVQIVKSFISVQINEKIIAIFDNDTEAKVAKRGLDKVEIPDNIKILDYPDIDLANNYPTLGPNGLANLNVNGLACSIEMYLGRDVLLQSSNNNELTPVQWKGYRPEIGSYQGEIMNKKSVLNKFDDKVSMCSSNHAMIGDYDWSSLEQIFKHVFAAFQ